MTRTTLVKWQLLACVGLVCQVYSGSAAAQSTAGSFSSVVTIGGSVKQEANGNNNTQVINAGGMNASKTGSFNSTVSVGGITQTTTGSGGVQTLNAGSMSNSSAGSFTANVNAGKLEQTGKGGERQEMDIGSVTNSTVSGSVNTTVNVRQGVKQVGEGEIAIGAVKNSNIGSFNNSITVNKVEGNNVRIGSVVGGAKYYNNGESDRGFRGDSVGQKYPNFSPPTSPPISSNQAKISDNNRNSKGPVTRDPISFTKPVGKLSKKWALDVVGYKIDSWTYSEGVEGATVKMPVYNSLPYYLAVEIYDENNNKIDTKYVDPKLAEGAIDNTFHAFSDMANLELGFESSATSAKTELDFFIPKNGKAVFSYKSQDALVMNFANLAISLTGEAAKDKMDSNQIKVLRAVITSTLIDMGANGIIENIKSGTIAAPELDILFKSMLKNSIEKSGTKYIPGVGQILIVEAAVINTLNLGSAFLALTKDLSEFDSTLSDPQSASI